MPKAVKKTMTSAVPGISVAEVRRHLAEARNLWEDGTPDSPFIVSLSNGKMSNGEFCFKFLLGQHSKRQKKVEK